MEFRLLVQLATIVSHMLLVDVYSHSSAAAACYPPDRLALHQLAFAFVEPTTAFVGWDDDDCCSWDGVVCSSSNTSRISKLLLSNKDLVGAIPGQAICSLSALSTLDLSNNFLTGSIPTCFARNLTNLRRLDLSYNKLNGSMLPVSALPHLAYLDLSTNPFESIPPFQTPRLQWLGLKNVWGIIDPSIPVFTNATPNLQYLDLSMNTFTTGITNLVTSSSPLLQLRHLDLSECSLSGEIPVTAIISQLPQLRTLLIDSNLLASKGAQVSELLCGLKSLEVFSATSCKLGGEMPNLASCKSPSRNLTILDLSDNQLGGPFPGWMSLFSNLQVLRLSHNNLDVPLLQPEWQNLTKLRVLELSGPMSHNTKPTTTFLLSQHMQNWLFRLPLTTLTLSSVGLANHHIPCNHLSLLNATLQHLDFSNNFLTNAHALQCLAHSNFTTLASLDLSQNFLAFNLGLATLPPLQRELNLASCQLQGELTDQFFGFFAPVPGLLIYLSHNSFSGTLPLGIGVLSNTLLLDLSYNNFTGPIPPSFANMTDLFYLQLENNNLEGDVPRELGNLTSLFTVSLGNNKLTKWLPTYIQSRDLEIIDLSYNRLEGDLQQTFFGHDHSLLENLVVLLLGHNRLSGAIPASLINGTTALYLSVIQLCDNDLTGTIPHTLVELFPSLTIDKHLDSWYNIYREFTLVVKNLELSYDYSGLVGSERDKSIFSYLDLSNNKLNGSIPGSLGDLSRLRYLNLSRNQLTGNIPSSLAKLSFLESLDLSYNRLQGSLPTSLSQLTKLGVFNVSFNEELSGPIPTNSPQFEQATSYIGDPKLCGDSILQSCSDMWVVTVPHLDQEIDKTESSLMKSVDKWIAIPGFFLGIAMGFLGALWVLKLIRFV